jgi:hypothetical protein
MTWRRSFRLDSNGPDAQHAAFVPALLIPAETPAMARPGSCGQMVIIVGKDRHVIVDASVDTAALARVLQVLERGCCQQVCGSGLSLSHTDMRKGMQGLSLLVQESLGRDPFAGDVFVFRGRADSLMKALWHDGIGLSLYANRTAPSSAPRSGNQGYTT